MLKNFTKLPVISRHQKREQQTITPRPPAHIPPPAPTPTVDVDDWGKVSKNVLDY